MIPDKLLINLKIISKIQKNGRIARSFDGIISLENDVFYQAFKRFITSDSRKQAVFEINSVITESAEILNHITNSKFMNKIYFQTGEYYKNCEFIELIVTELELAKTGIENLKFTYQNDQNIVSQIDIIILKINTLTKDFSQKLYYYKSLIPQQIYHSTPQEIPQQQLNNSQITESPNLELNSIKIDNGQDDEDNDNYSPV